MFGGRGKGYSRPTQISFTLSARCEFLSTDSSKLPYGGGLTPDSNFSKTRMHSSRMRTGRSLTVCRRLLPGGGYAPWGGKSSGGCAWSGGVSAPGGWGICSGGCLVRGGLASQHALRQTPSPPLPPPRGQNHRCLQKHYLGPSSLRPVTKITLSTLCNTGKLVCKMHPP